MGLLRHQADISAQVPMPTDRVDDASTVTNVSAETLTWFYLNAGAWASGTGQAAGTLVWGKLVFDGILNSNKATLGSYNNTSLSFGATTRADALVSVPESVWGELQFLSPTDQAAKMAVYLTTNGQYAIDHRFGQVWCKMKATVADDAVSYSYKAPIAGGGGPSANVAVTSQVPGVGATNLGKAEDAAHTSGDTGVMSLAVRNDAGTALAGTTGDYIPLTTDANGNLRAIIASQIPGTGATNLGKAEDAAHASGDTGVMSLAVRNDAGTVLAGADGDYIPFTTDASGNLRAIIASQIPGTGATNLGKAEDAAHASGDTGVMSLAVRNDAGTVLAGTDGDYIPITTDASGNLRAIIASQVPGVGATNLGKAEDAAHASGDTGVMMLAVRNDAGTVLAGTDGDYIPLTTDPNGSLRVATGSGGSAGGGNNTYSTEQGDFTATVTNASNAIVLSVDSIGGVALTTANFANGILKVQDVSLTPDEWKTITLDKFTWTPGTKTLDTAGCTGAFTFGTGDVVSLVITGSDKMRDATNDAMRNVPIRDLSDQNVVQTVVDTTNVATGTYYPSSSGQSTGGYRDLTTTGQLIDGVAETTTLTIEVSNIGGTTAADWHTVYVRDDKNNVNVNSMGATNETKNYALSAPGIGKFAFYRYLITTSAPTNTVKIHDKLTY
jgi:hypothetical protein